jgi:hypothetical protein
MFFIVVVVVVVVAVAVLNRFARFYLILLANQRARIMF